jgi:hypothetical protein
MAPQVPDDYLVHVMAFGYLDTESVPKLTVRDWFTEYISRTKTLWRPVP